MLLKPKKIHIRTGGRHIALLHEDTAQMLDLHLGDRVTLKSDRTSIIATVDVQTDHFPKSRIGLFLEAFDALNLESDDVVAITPIEKPESLIFVREKLDGKKLSAQQFDAIIGDITSDLYTDVEITYFVSGIYTHGIDDEETVFLIKAILKHGKTLRFDSKIVADKHCIGGVPGNRVTPIVVPIMVASGIIMPKTSSRAITSPAGTADALETVCKVTQNAHRLQEIVKEAGGFMVWGGGVQLAPADDRIIRVEYPLSLDPEGMLLASIMAKKASVGTTHLIIDIPVGKTVKIKDISRAKHLKERFEHIAEKLEIKAAVIITDGAEPIGNGIGPLLEMIDVIKVLKREDGAPEDLREKSLFESAILLELTGKAEKGKGKAMAEKLLDSGKAWKAFQKMIKAQGKKRMAKPGKFTFDVTAPMKGKIMAIDNKMIGRIARIAGAPKDKTAGLYLHKKLNDSVEQGKAIYTIYASSKDRLNFAREEATKNSAYSIG